jgi:hypothetical protein
MIRTVRWTTCSLEVQGQKYEADIYYFMYCISLYIHLQLPIFPICSYNMVSKSPNIRHEKRCEASELAAAKCSGAP